MLSRSFFATCLILCESSAAFSPSYRETSRVFDALSLCRVPEGIGIGIDLGTTFSAVAVLDDDGQPQIIPTLQGDRTIPSVVAFWNGTTIVGKDALEIEGAYRHVKRILGTGGKIDPSIASVVPHLIANANGKTFKKDSLLNQLHDAEHHPTLLKSTIISNESLRPEFVSGCILQSLKHQAETFTGKVVTRAVIGVPAYFNDAQRQATLDAAKLAGLDKVKLLREPEAAALAYGKLFVQTRSDTLADEDELVLVLDLGGGTYDVSILVVGEVATEILCTSGNVQLGGSDMDQKVANHLMFELQRQTKKSKRWSPHAIALLLRASEKIRIFLSNNRYVNLALPMNETEWLSLSDPSQVILGNDYLGSDDDSLFDGAACNSTHLLYRLSRKKMESLCHEELLALLRPLREVAIAGGALLPGDADPAVVQMTLELEQDDNQEFPDFYADDATSAAAEVFRQMKQVKKSQQKGRRNAHQVAKNQRKYRAEKSKLQKNNEKIQTGIHGRPLSRVVLVGGTTRMPAIGKLIEAVTGVVPQRTVNPDEAVALGCAVHVGVLDGDERMATVLNPMQAAILRALAQQRGLDSAPERDDDDGFDFTDEDIEVISL
jgi:molecular chaperone DnaK (HSP70)